MQSSQPKQYLPLNGRSVLSATLERIQTHFNPDQTYLAHSDLPEAPPSSVVGIPGGGSRAKSVLLLVERALLDFPEETWAVVHDAARPCLSRALAERLLGRLWDSSQERVAGVVAALPSSDALARFSGERLEGAIDRKAVLRLQTPQVFPLGLLREALLFAGEALDESSAVKLRFPEAKIAWVRGEERNLKLTHPEDFPLVEALDRLMEIQGE